MPTLRCDSKKRVTVAVDGEVVLRGELLDAAIQVSDSMLSRFTGRLSSMLPGFLTGPTEVSMRLTAVVEPPGTPRSLSSEYVRRIQGGTVENTSRKIVC